MMARLGAYVLDRKIGAGGMAEVFLAHGPRGVCVLKVPHAHLCDDAEFVRMFLDEAQLLALLHHRGIAEIFELGQADGRYYLAMEYVPGFDLMTLSLEHERQGELIAPELCARIVADLAAALHAAHEAKGPDGQPLHLVHRDVTPHNVLLSRQGVVKLIDFGVARAANTRHRTQAGFVKGKYPYMAPEQVLGQVIDRRVDVYALGLLLYELLTNTRALQGDNEIEQTDAARSPQIRRVEQLRPNVPVPLRQILVGCLHPEADGRYPTALAVQEDLEKYLALERHSVGQEDLLRLFRVVAADSGLAEELALAGRPTEQEQPVTGGPVVLPAGPVDPGLLDALGAAPTAPSQRAISPVPLTNPVKPEVVAPAAPPTGTGLTRRRSSTPQLVLAGLSVLVIAGVLAAWQPWAEQAAQGVDAGAPVVTEDFHFPPAAAGEAVAAVVPVPEAPEVDAGSEVAAEVLDRRAAVVSVSSSLDAEVLVDGKSWGRAPTDLELEAGRHVIVVRNKAEKFQRVVTVTLKPGESRELVIAARKGTLTVDVQPFAQIRVDGSPVTSSPVSFTELSLYEGPHTVECVLEDPALPSPRRKTQTVTVSPDEKKKVSFNMLSE